LKNILYPKIYTYINNGKQYLFEKEFTNLQALLRMNFVYFYSTKHYLQCITYYNNIIELN